MTITEEERHKYIVEMTDDLVSVVRKWSASDSKIAGLNELSNIGINAFISFSAAFLAATARALLDQKDRDELLAHVMRDMLLLTHKNLNDTSERQLQ